MATISGGERNFVGGAADHATIGGGYSNSIAGSDGPVIDTIGGGSLNSIQPDVAYAMIGGGLANVAGSNSLGSAIGGGSTNVIQSGSTNSTIAGGVNNSVQGFAATIGGGFNNTNTADASFVGGGTTNIILVPAHEATIGGGAGNIILGGGRDSTIGGGVGNTNFGPFATIPGGVNNLAGANAFAAGSGALAGNQGSFVWADASGASLGSTNNNSVTMRGAGGFRLFSNPGATLGVYLAPNGSSWSVISDRNAKKNIRAVNYDAVLDKLSEVPVEQWNYKAESDADTPNLGPMAQDFKHAFYPGRDDKSISTLEFDGVEMAAIQGLNQKLQQKDAEIKELQQSVAELRQLVSHLKQTKSPLAQIKKGNMKKSSIGILLAMFLAAAARADTPLTLTTTPTLEGCLFNNIVLFIDQPAAGGSFTLNGVSGAGTFQSDVIGYSPDPPYTTEVVFNYTIDLSGISPAANHCVKLVIHFGNPDGCTGPAVGGNPSQFQSATLAPHGDITFVFAGGCLHPGQSSVSFNMLSSAGFKTNFVTIIDDYTDLATGQTNETRINVPAMVPDIPPDLPPWAYAPPPIPNVFFQGALTFPTNFYQPTNRNFDFQVQLFNAQSNGLAVTPAFTQSVQVVNGLFNLPLPFDAISMGDGSVRFLSVGVRPSGSNTDFTPINPPLPLTPAPQAIYAHSAGVVADLTPGQAVTSLNGLTDVVGLQPGPGIAIGTNGNTLTISTQPGVPSDRGIKTDVVPASADKILARLAALPISSWRYTNETADIRHIGPMAQDFRAAFGLGHGDKFIEFVDEEGVALTAIQGLNQKVDELKGELLRRDAENAELRERLEKVERLLDAAPEVQRE